jgi:hypothetical protein
LRAIASSRVAILGGFKGAEPVSGDLSELQIPAVRS